MVGEWRRVGMASSFILARSSDRARLGELYVLAGLVAVLEAKDDGVVSG